MQALKRFSQTTLLAGLFCFATLPYALAHAQVQATDLASGKDSNAKDSNTKALDSKVANSKVLNNPAIESVPNWKSLTLEQQTALKPMQADWAGLDANRKKKWLAVAQRYQTMSAVDQTRMHERMSQWSKLTAAQRSAARDNYSAVLSSPNTTGSTSNDAAAKASLNDQWTKYQALSPEKRALLAEQANKVDAGKTKPLRAP